MLGRQAARGAWFALVALTASGCAGLLGSPRYVVACLDLGGDLVSVGPPDQAAPSDMVSAVRAACLHGGPGEIDITNYLAGGVFAGMFIDSSSGEIGFWRGAVLWERTLLGLAAAHRRMPTSPTMGAYTPNAYGPGVHSDATGRPFEWQTQQGEATQGPVIPNGYGLGVGRDQYGRPVYPVAR